MFRDNELSHKNLRILKRAFIIVIIFIVIIVLFGLYNLYKVLVYPRVIESQFKFSDIRNTSQIRNKDPRPLLEELKQREFYAGPSKVCEYKYQNTKIITQPNTLQDQIQEVIGYQNNKVGLYIYAEVEEFIELASEMVNANNGDWGYVLIPYNVKDYNRDRWEKVFKNLREKKLIPIIQLYDISTKDEEKINDQINRSTNFLATLDWPIKQRYVSVYNEMNDKNFWKGDIDPEGYAEILDKTIEKFKSTNKDFFILNGAFNASARTGEDHLDMRTYMRRMNDHRPSIFKKLDGWASHSYPQPNFSGSPKARGRDSIRAYEWELNFLEKEFLIDTSKLPVFITETGWAHAEGDNYQSRYLSQHLVADNIRYAFENVWLPDDRVVAVTPFTIRFNPPHDHFSWITANNNPYPQFNSIKDMKKTEGRPPVVESIETKALECRYE